jgi:signal transduction histidine kinase
MKRYLEALLESRTWLPTLDLLLDLPFAILWFTFFTTVTSVGFGMVITLIGIPILTFAMLAARFAGTVERHRVELFHGVHIDEPARTPRRNDGLLERVIAPLRDTSTYRDILYVWLVQPVLGVVNFTLTVVAWSIPLFVISLPFSNTFGLDSWVEILLFVPAGLALVPLPPRATRALARLDVAAARWLLSPSRTEELEERIDTLRETQARSVDIAMADRRQIERDLHDGAQQRLLTLGMDLSMALEKFETDPDAARALVGDAHHELQRAVAELRNLARGVHPAVLTDRGLDAALSSLAARSPVPVRLDVNLGARPPASVEATAYFIVAESLTNAARYANATAIDVRVRQLDGKLQVEVADNGLGGAQERPGGGLAGLADRASSVEGSLRVSSPAGGPTIVAAEFPCAS